MSLKFSVVIATYNEREYLLECLRSVVQQTYAAHEVIVVADGCSDGTAEAVRAAFPNVRVVEQPNLGKGIARNTGIFHASGDWICFSDHDDLWHPDKLRVVAEYIEVHPECGAVHHPVWLFTTDVNGPTNGFGASRDFVAASLEECYRAVQRRNCNATGDADLPRRDNLSSVLDRRFGATSGLVVRRDLAVRAGGFCPMQFNGEDWTFAVNVARLCEWHVIPRKLAFMRLHPRSGSYDPGAGLALLSAYINAWFGGLPLGKRSAGLSFLSDLGARKVYRRDVQTILWTALIRGDFRTARLVRAASAMLLPRFWDRVAILVPPAIAWRIGRFRRKPRAAAAPLPGRPLASIEGVG